MAKKIYHTSVPVHAISYPTKKDELLEKNTINQKIESVVELLRFVDGFSDSEKLKAAIADMIKVAITPLIVTDITALAGDQLEALNCGDHVIKRDSSGDHCYTVSFKGATGRCLTYCDCENVETVAYEKTGDAWAYDSTDITHIATT